MDPFSERKEDEDHVGMSVAGTAGIAIAVTATIAGIVAIFLLRPHKRPDINEVSCDSFTTFGKELPALEVGNDVDHYLFHANSRGYGDVQADLGFSAVVDRFTSVEIL